MNIEGWKILLTGIGFYDYEEAIITYLESKGAKVSYFSSVFTSIVKKSLLRIGKKDVAAKLSSRKILDLIAQQPKDIDRIIIIKGEDFGEEHVRALEEKYPHTHKTLYLWDSLRRLPNRDLLLNSYNTILTFDRLDAVNYGIKFRPLFFRHAADWDVETVKYDISFVGFMHSMRYRILNKLKAAMDSAGLTYKFILTTGTFDKWYQMHIKHSVSCKDTEMVRAEHIPYMEYMDIMLHSNVILDISHPQQSGLTMRTIEALAMGKKLLTTNRDIENYSFDGQQFRILDLEHLDMDFIRVRQKIFSNMSEYTLDKFIDDILQA